MEAGRGCWGLAGRPGYDDINRLVARLRPFRGLVYFLLLLDDRRRQGYI